MTESQTHMRPFFPAAADFAAATTPHFRLLVDEFGYDAPEIDDAGAAFDVRYDGPRTAVLLSWDVEGGFFACHLVPRLGNGALDPDYEHWLSPNEILGVHGAVEEWIRHEHLENVDETGFGRTMDRQAAILREHCADVLRGDWTIYGAARLWAEENRYV